MRYRLTAIASAVIGAVVIGAISAPASAQVPPDDTESWGDLIDGGAEVGVFQPGTQPGGGGGGGGGGGSQSSIVCTYTMRLANGEVPFSIARATAEYEAFGSPVPVEANCMDGATVVSFNVIQWTPAVGNPVDPAALAQMAMDRLAPPRPAGDMSPSVGVGTQAQMTTYFWLDNWPSAGNRPSASASAGGVTVTAVATPIAHSWLIRDALRGNTVIACGATAGVAFSGTGTPPNTPCKWTPAHSSAGQTARSAATGEPCFPATVRVVWNVTWSGGNLGNLTTLASTCIVVHEIQAVVSNP